MKESFPKSEIRSYLGQKKLLKDNRYKIYCEYKNDEIIAFLCVWDLEGVYFLEHFAVSKEYRNRGIGSNLIKKVCESLQGRIFLEVELPESDLQKRRIEFYKRCGFFYNAYEYFQPSFGKDLPAIPLKIMTYCKQINFEEFLEIKKKVYKEVYGQKI